MNKANQLLSVAKSVVLASVISLVGLFFSFVSIFFAITSGAGTSVLGTLAPYGTSISNVLTIIGNCLPALIVSRLAYLVFIRSSRFFAIWLSLSFTLPNQLFWLYLAISADSVGLKWSSSVIFILMSILLLATIYHFKVKAK